MPTGARIETKKWDAIYRRVRSPGPRRIIVGVMDDGELARIAAIHEFGAPGAHIPERSFIRSTCREQRKEIAKLFAAGARGILSGKVKRKDALDLIGSFMAGAIKAKIRSNIAPALRPATIARKGSSLALVDTGRLINGIGWKAIP